MCLVRTVLDLLTLDPTVDRARAIGTLKHDLRLTLSGVKLALNVRGPVTLLLGRTQLSRLVSTSADELTVLVVVCARRAVKSATKLVPA